MDSKRIEEIRERLEEPWKYNIIPDAIWLLEQLEKAYHYSEVSSGEYLKELMFKQEQLDAMLPAAKWGIYNSPKMGGVRPTAGFYSREEDEAARAAVAELEGKG